MLTAMSPPLDPRTYHTRLAPEGPAADAPFALAWQAWDAAPDDLDRPTVVLLHGYLDSARTFDAVARALAADYRVVAPDHRGHGDSDRVGAGGYYHFPDYVRDLALLLPVMTRGRRVALVGHSMGATIAAYFAGAFPESVAALVLLDSLGPAAPAPDEGPRLMRRWLTDLRLLPAKREPPMPDLATVARRLARTSPYASEARLLELAEVASTPDPAGGYAWRFDPLHRTTAPTPFDLPRFIAFLRAITAPTLVVWGEHTPNRPPDAAHRLAQLPRATELTLAGTAHNLHHERPRELAMALLAFLYDSFPPDEAP
jgi:pimeloyl-ACP methyl ester carboxylesterase